MDFGEKVYEGIPAYVGLGFALFEECSIAELVNSAAKYKGGRKLSPGHAVKALIGPMLSPSKKISVCRLDDYYRAAPVDVLFGDSVDHGSLNDRAVGEVLDILSKADMQELLWECASRCREKYGLASDVYHMDATNFPVYALTGTMDPEGTVVPAYGGNSKNGRNDLMQYDAEVVTDGDRTVTYLRAYSGNTADTVMNADTIRFLKDRIDCERSTIIADSKIVTKDLIRDMVEAGIGFISKCPANFSDSVRSEILCSVEHSFMEVSDLGEGYGHFDTSADTVCGKLRFIAYSTPFDADAALRYHREQGERELSRAFGPFRKRRFNCIPDTMEAFNDAMSKLEDHGYVVAVEVVEHREHGKRPTRGRPPKDAPPREYKIVYGAVVVWRFDEERARSIAVKDEVRVLVTNLPFDTRTRENLRDGATSDDIIRAYLDEYKPEHTFRLLKSGLGMSKVYLHKPNREAAMMGVLGIAAVLTSVMDCVFRDRSPGATFHNVSWKLFGASVRYKRTSEYLYIDGPEGSGSEIREVCEALEIDPDLMLSRR